MAEWWRNSTWQRGQPHVLDAFLADAKTYRSPNGTRVRAKPFTALDRSLISAEFDGKEVVFAMVYADGQEATVRDGDWLVKVISGALRGSFICVVRDRFPLTFTEEG